MSQTSDSPVGSFWSTIGTSLLHGCIILLLLLVSTLLGWIDQLDGLLEAWMGGLMGEGFEHRVPAAVSWLLTIAVAFGLPALLLSCHHGWQRITLWLASVAVLALWVPVLGLAAHRPEVSLVWLAAAGAGLLVAGHLYWITRKEGTNRS